MKKYFIYDKNMGYLCRDKGIFISEDKKHIRNSMTFWSNFNEPRDRRLRYYRISGLIEICFMRIFNKDLNPMLIKIDGDKK